jgi:hypothetical protein
VKQYASDIFSIEKGIYAIDFFVYRNAGPQPTPSYNEQMVGETRAAQSKVRASGLLREGGATGGCSVILHVTR